MWWAPSPSKEEEEPSASLRIAGSLLLGVRVAAAATMAIGSTALLGWVAGITWLRAPIAGRGFAAMAPNTACLLMLSGLSLGLSVDASARRRRVAKLLALVGALLTAAILLEDAVGVDLGIDTALIHAQPARPAALAAIALLLTNLALLVLDVGTPRCPRLAEILAIAAALLVSFGFSAFVVGSVELYDRVGGTRSDAVALNTSVALWLLAGGVLAARPRSGLAALLGSRLVGGQVARRLLALALTFPVLGYLAVLVQRAGAYGPSGTAVVYGVSWIVVEIATTVALGASLERREERRRRYDSENREWRRFFDEASFGVAIATVDGKLGRVNGTFARMHGYSRAELEGRPLVDLFPSYRHAALAEQQRIVREEGTHRWYSEHLRRDGTVFPVVTDVAAIRDEYGKVLYSAAYVQDISREKAAEAAQSRLASLVRSAEDAIVVEGLDGTVLDWNQGAERVFGFRAGEMVGKPVAAIVPEERRRERGAIRARALLGETVAGVESERIRKDGTRIPVAVTVSPIREAEDRVTGISTIERDISAFKQLEREREEWASVVAHDLRQPSTTIRYAAELLARAKDQSATRDSIDRIRRASDRLERMIQDLLDVSRVEARRLSVRAQELDVAALVKDTIEATPGIAERSRTELCPGAERAWADRDRCAQVMSNLLSNAQKYSTPGTPIVVEARRSQGDMVEVSVTNDGPGIAPDEMPKLFSRFGRTRSAHTAGAPGLGLGLYMSRGIIEAHGGKLWAESTPGEKTRFRFTVPAHARVDEDGRGRPDRRDREAASGAPAGATADGEGASKPSGGGP